MKILIADDDAMTRIALRKNLQKWGYEVLEVKNGGDAWERLSVENPPQIAILDWMMPEMEGVEICQRLHKDEKSLFIYTILLTSRTDKEDIVKALDSGAHDFLSKPVYPPELRSRIAVGVRLVKAEEKLRDFAEKMKQLAITDALTGAYNRRFLFTQAQKELERAKRYNTPLSFLLMDIDYFKKINDTYGHLAGDKVLKILSGHCKKMLRSSDIFARYGGEEFVVLLPDSHKDSAFDLAERLRRTLGSTIVEFESKSFKFTVSIGIASMEDNDQTPEPILKQADNALYKAKQMGRNQSVRA